MRKNIAAIMMASLGAALASASRAADYEIRLPAHTSWTRNVHTPVNPREMAPAYKRKMPSTDSDFAALNTAKYKRARKAEKRQRDDASAGRGYYRTTEQNGRRVDHV